MTSVPPSELDHGQRRPFAARLLGAAPVIAQLCQAATSFTLTLMFARVLGAAAFGSFAAYSLVYVLGMSAFRAVFGEQLLAQPSKEDARAVGHLAVGLGAVYVALGLTVGLLSRDSGLVLGGLYLALFTASDGVRYAWMSFTGSTRRAVLLGVDALRAIAGGSAFLLALDHAAPVVLEVLAVLTSAVWVAIGITTFGPARPRRLLSYLRSRGAFEAAMSAQFLVGTGITQFVPLLAVWAFGTVAFGQMRLAQVIVAPAATLAAAFQPTVIAYYASRAGQDDRATLTRMLTICAAACLIVIPFGVLVAGRFVGAIAPGSGPTVLAYLWPAAVGVAFIAVSLPGGAMIRVRRLASVSFVGQMIGTVCTVAAAALAALGTPLGFAWALTFGAFSTVGASYVLLFRRLRRL